MFATTSMETEPSLRYFRHLVCLALFQDTEDALGDLSSKARPSLGIYSEL